MAWAATYGASSQGQPLLFYASEGDGPPQTLRGASQGATLALASPPLWALAQATASLSEATQSRHGLGCHVRCYSSQGQPLLFYASEGDGTPQTLRGASQGATLALASPPLWALA